MAKKIICIMCAKSYGGSYGIGDTKDQAKKNARKALGEKPGKTVFREVDVPDGRKLVIQTLPNGVNWYTVPEDAEGA